MDLSPFEEYCRDRILTHLAALGFPMNIHVLADVAAVTVAIHSPNADVIPDSSAEFASVVAAEATRRYHLRHPFAGSA